LSAISEAKADNADDADNVVGIKDDWANNPYDNSSYYPTYTLSSNEGTPLAVARGVVKIASKQPVLTAAPNPFALQTQLGFILPSAGQVSLKIFDLNGRVVQAITNGMLTSGQHNYQVNSQGLAAGVYIAKLQADRRMINKRIRLIR